MKKLLISLLLLSSTLNTGCPLHNNAENIPPHDLINRGDRSPREGEEHINTQAKTIEKGPPSMHGTQRFEKIILGEDEHHVPTASPFEQGSRLADEQLRLIFALYAATLRQERI